MSEEKLIEAHINEVLNGGSKRIALDFIAFLRANAITPDQHESGDGWSLVHKGESIGFIIVSQSEFPGPWTLWFNSCEFGSGESVSDDLKEAAWNHASICGNFFSNGKDCGCGDQPGFTRVIFGKEFQNRCHSPLMFHNPDAETMERAKKLMLMLTQNMAA